MKTIRSIDLSAPLCDRSVATLGNFDGVHLGHQRILAEVVRMARETEAQAVVITFDPHPASVVAPARAPKRICTLDDRLMHLAASGVDIAWVVPFSAEVARIEAEAFIDELLVGHLRIEHIVVGPDCRFGRDRRGSIQMLVDRGHSAGFSVDPVQPVDHEGARISSSRVRERIAAGDMASAHDLLGRPYRVVGPVERGDQRGRLLGFPTANIVAPEELLLPARGVYHGTLWTRGLALPAAVNVGTRPTFDGQAVSFEAHAVDWTGDLYGETVAVELHTQLRHERRFQSAEALSAQLALDVEAVRRACRR
jgi:riboflavin kinase/FMN adenylyltransferase